MATKWPSVTTWPASWTSPVHGTKPTPTSTPCWLPAGQHAAAFWHGTAGLRMVPWPQTAHRRVISSPAGAVLSTNHGAICRSIVSSEMLSFDVSAVPALQAGSVVQHFRSFFNVFPEIFRKHIFHFKRPAFPKRSHNSRKSFIILSFIFYHFQMHSAQFFHTNSIFIVLKCHKILVFANGRC